MIADLKNFTSKKLLDSRFVIAGAGTLIFLLTGFTQIQDWPLGASVFVLAMQAGLLTWVDRTFRKTDLLTMQVRKSQVLVEEASDELVRLRKNYAAQSLFIETAGAELLESSRAVYDAAGFLNSKRLRTIVPITGFGIEETLLANAERAYSISHDIVALAQLRKGDVCLLEQEIDPVELVSWCATEVWKKHGKNSVITLIDTPSYPVLIKGDLSKLKQLLVKFLASAVWHLQIVGATVQVRIFTDPIGRLTISLKLGGRQLSPIEFEKLCSPSDNCSDEDERVSFDMAIAKRLAKLHGGDIVIHDQTSSGTILAFFLPQERVSSIGLDNVRQKTD